MALVIGIQGNVGILSVIITKRKGNLIVINMHVVKQAVKTQQIYYQVTVMNIIALMVLVLLLDIQQQTAHIVKDIILKHTKSSHIRQNTDLLVKWYYQIQGGHFYVQKENQIEAHGF